jgi:hypothetical protein
MRVHFQGGKMEREKHPVWNVYDLLRTSKLNVKYNQHLSSRYKKYIAFFDFGLAITAPTSTIATFSLWDSEEGKIIWQILVTITGLLAFVRPFLKLNDRNSNCEGLLAGYDILYEELTSLKNKISNTQQYGPKHIKEFELIEKRRKNLKPELSDFCG